MKTKNLLATSAVALCLSFNGFSQEPILEKTYDVSNAAKRGFLESIEVNKDKGTIDMLYVLPNMFTTKRESFLGIITANLGSNIKYEIYSYDKDLNQLGTSREEERAYRVRYKEYSYTTVMPSIKLSCMCLSFSQVETKAEYNWYYGYHKTTKDLGKTKAENEDGGKYSYTGSYYDLVPDKSILVLAGKKVKKEPWSAFTKYDLLKVNQDINVSVTESFEFEFGNNVIYSAPLQDARAEINDELPRDWVIVFAPMSGSKTNPTDLTYMRVSPQGKIMERFIFKSPSNGWHIEGAYEREGSVYLYGSAITKDPAKKYYSDVVNKGWDELTYTNYQLAKITKGKLDYVSAPSMEGITTNQSNPASQKKPIELDGSEHVTTGIQFLKSGDILFTYQDFETKSAGSDQSSSNYKRQHGVSLLHFDAAGNFKKNFGVEINPDQKKMHKFSSHIWELPADNGLYPASDGKSLSWFIRSVKDVACTGTADENHNDVECKPMNSVDYVTVDLSTGTLSEVKILGEDKKDPFYLFNKTGGTEMDGYLYYFSETEKGDKMRLTRIELPK